MTITAVTGATGQVGHALCAALRAAGREVRAVVLPGDHGADRLRKLGVQIIRGDVRDQAALRRAFDGADAVYHLAAMVDTSSHHDARLWHVNVGGARNAARAALRCGVKRFVYFSSIVVFDPDPTDEPLDELRPRLRCPKVAPYVRSKVQAEAEVRAQLDRGLDLVVVHPTVVVGPNETHHVGIVQSLIFDYFSGSLPATFAGGFNLVGVTDLVQGALAAEARGRTGESYILGGRWYDVGEFLAEAQRIAGTKLPRVTIPLWMAHAGLPVVLTLSRLTKKRPLYNREELRQLQGNRRISIAKARQELGYDPQGLAHPLQQIHQEWLHLRS